MGEHVVVADQDRFHPGKAVRQRKIRHPEGEEGEVTPAFYIALRFADVIVSGLCCSA